MATPPETTHTDTKTCNTEEPQQKHHPETVSKGPLAGMGGVILNIVFLIFIYFFTTNVIKHIDYIKEKAWRINIMRKLKYDLDRKSLETIYIVFIRPILEYADVLWDNCTQAEKQELEKIQLEAARIATGATKLVSIQKLSDEIGWEELDSRRKKHKLVFF